MSTLKKSLSIILAILMLVSSVPIAGLTAFAVEADEPVFIAEEILDPIVPEGWYLTGKTNFDDEGSAIYEIDSLDSNDALIINRWIYADGREADNPDVLPAYPVNEETGVPDVMGDDELPASYDSRSYGYITPVESQVGGTCWAHTSIACIETAYVKQGYGETIDLSEYHTVWYSKNGYFEDNADSLNDGYKIKVEDDVLDEGGNYIDVQNATLNFAGAALESRFPLTSTSSSDMMTEMKNTFTYDNKYVHDVVVDSINSVYYYDKYIEDNMWKFDKSSPKINYVKQAVMDYGAVYLSYCSDGTYYANQYSVSKPCAYYNPNDVTTNHAVTLVGWDDNFSRDNFGSVKPKNDGAWLLKNSWGTGWGDDGYFWISYEDKSISGYMAVFTVDDASDYEDVYMYDGFGYNQSLFTSSGVLGTANVFTAKNDIYLTKVSYGTTQSVNYTLKIYKGLPESCTDPTTDGPPIYTDEGYTYNKKYIDIMGDVKIGKGERFSVVLEMERAVFEGADTELDEEYGNYTSNAGESFFKQGSSGTWVDTTEGFTYNGTERFYNNTCIRAVAKLQNDSGTYKVTFRDGDIYSETAISANGVVALPEKEGHTYVFTYNGEDFDGTNVTQDSIVTMHCYPTNGTVSEANPCTTEYKCIYCDDKVKDAETNHNNVVTIVPATVKSIGYTFTECTTCGASNKSDYTLYEGAVGGEYKKTGLPIKYLWWQYIDGNLCIFPKGNFYLKMPDFTSSSATPWAAYLNEITTLIVSDGITYLGDCMFSDLPALSEVNLPDTITEIGDYCFSGAKAIKTFDCPESLTKIGTYAFNDAVSLKEINYNDAIKTLSDYAYNGCTSLTEVVIPGTVTSVGSYLFYNCSDITKITVEEGVTRIPYLVWNNSVLEEIVLPSTLTSANFMNYAYLDKYTVSPENNVYCSVDGVVYSKDMTTLHAYPASKADKYYKIPETVDEIDSYVFSFLRSLKYLDMSDCAVTVIKDKTFNQAQSLLYVNLPEGLTSIYNQAFYRTRISNIYVPSTVDTLQDPPFTTNNYSSAYYFVPNFYTDSETAAIKTWADTNGFTCTVLHTDHSFATEMTDMKKAPNCKDEGTSLKTCACGSFEYTTTPATGEHSLVKGATVAPTCDEAGYTAYTCSACGTTVNQDEVTALGHDFAWIIDKDATCGADGVKHEKCSRCDAVQSVDTVIPATGEHSYTSKVTAPTCTEGGYTTYTCVTCGKTYTANYKDALNHFYKWIIDKDATCGADGVKHEKCARCEAVRNENTVIPATGEHSYTSEITTPATHLVTGVKTFTCSGCGDSYTETIAKLEGHSYSKNVTAPTCNDKGYTTYTCVCGDSYVSDYVDALGHSYSSKVTTAPTCEEKGVKTYTCANCGDTYTEEIDALGHSYSKKVTAPTCEDKGYTTYTCACGDSYVADYVDALGHSFAWVIDKEATCGENGAKHEKCSRCDAVQSVDAVIPATGKHSYTSEITTPATHLVTGVKTFTCSGCGDSYTETIAKLEGHSYSKNVTAPTCNDKGYTTYTCACGDSYVADYVDALGHSFTWVIDKEATCGENGVKHEKCSRCDATQNLDTVIPATGKHSYTSEITTPATHLVTGVKTFTCSGCGDSYTETIAKLEGHSYSKNVTAPTCENEGYTTYTCACGDSYVADYVDALGHSYGEWTQTKAPTCTEKGKEERSCSACGGKESREVAKTGHSYTVSVTAPTCEGKGYTTYTCSACGNGYTSDIVDALGHSYGEWAQTKAPTCTEKGKEERSCSACGGKESREVATTGHSYTVSVTAPTCEGKGYTTYTCSACGNGYTSDIVDALGHSYGEWAQTKAPTCTEKGKEERSCSACGGKESREVAKIDHSYGEWIETKAPTCTEKGFKVKICSACGAKAGSEIMTTDHSFATKVIAATCTEKGYTTHYCKNCTYSYNDTYISAKGHVFVGNDGICEICGENVAKNCSCMCHKTGFMGFIYKIISFFWKLFKMNPVCACGIEHY